MIQKSFEFKKFIKLVLEITFYNLIFYIVFYVAGYPNGIKDIFKIIPGIIELPETFIGNYLILYLLVPMLNKSIKSLSEKQHLVLIGILLIYYSLIGTLFFRDT